MRGRLMPCAMSQIAAAPAPNSRPECGRSTFLPGNEDRYRRAIRERWPVSTCPNDADKWIHIYIYTHSAEILIQSNPSRGQRKLPTIPNPLECGRSTFLSGEGDGREPAPPWTDLVSSQAINAYNIYYYGGWRCFLFVFSSFFFFFFFFLVFLVQPFPFLSLVIMFRVGVGVRIRWRRTGNRFHARWGEWWAIFVNGLENHICPLLLHGLCRVRDI